MMIRYCCPTDYDYKWQRLWFLTNPGLQGCKAIAFVPANKINTPNIMIMIMIMMIMVIDTMVIMMIMMMMMINTPSIIIMKVRRIFMIMMRRMRMRMKVVMVLMVIIQESGCHLQYQNPSPPPIFLSERTPWLELFQQTSKKLVRNVPLRLKADKILLNKKECWGCSVLA